MKLTELLITHYLSFIYPQEKPEKILAQALELKGQVARGQRDLANTFVTLSREGKITSSLHLTLFHESTYAIQLPTRVLNDDSVKSHDVVALLAEAKDRLHFLGAKRGEFRLTEKPHLLAIAEALPKLGFNPSHVRIEFQAKVEELPGEEGTPFEWRPVTETGDDTLAAAGRILETAGDGDPDWGSEDDNAGLLASYLADPEFKSTLDCIHIGLINKEVAAIVVAQVVPTSGWSRLTYMGLVPAFRKKGLGKWVHRHGFAMMRAQNGKLYQGGTVRGNHAMEALFRGHGCSEFRTMQEWILEF